MFEEREYCKCNDKICEGDNPLVEDYGCLKTHTEEVFDRSRNCILVQEICDDYNCILCEWERPIDCSVDDITNRNPHW